jgi:hypothetical protein
MCLDTILSCGTYEGILNSGEVVYSLDGTYYAITLNSKLQWVYRVLTW